MSPIYTGDKFGFSASTSAGGGAGQHVYNNAGMVFTPAGAYGNAGPNATMMQNEYKDQKFWTENHYFAYTDPTTTYTDGGFIFVRAPQSGTYTFKIRGAFGGPSPDWTNGQNKGGSPWYIKGEVDLVGGRWIGILVGQKGGEVRDSVNSGGGGGGATYLFELNGSESETSISNSYIESASVTCLLVAAGGNGANWQSWNSQDVPARGETSTGATDWILGAINAGNNWGYDIFGRGAFGGSFNYTPYSTVNVHNAAGADAPWYNNYGSTAGMEKRSGMPILDSSNKISNKSGLGGIHWEASNYNTRYNNQNRDPNSSSHGGIGGFGGGAGGRLEGGGGGGYWGGAAWQENQYNTTYNYGAQSYAHPTRVTVSVSSIYGDGTSGYGNELCGLDRFDRARRALDNGHPHPESHGKLYLCPKAPKATAIGEAVFHADGHNIGEDKPGVGKVTKYDWYVPEGVTSISVVTVGGGGSGMARHDGASGGGGSLAYKNNIAVTPGQRIGVQVGCGGFMRSQDISYRSPKGTDSKITVYPVGSSGVNYYKATPDNQSGNSYVNLGANLFPSNAYLTYTVEVWCRPLTSPSGQCWIVDQHPGGSGRLFMGADSGNLAFFSGGMYNTSTSFGNTGSWAHLAFVANGNGSVTIFKDGTLIGTSGTGLITTSPDNQNTLWGQDTTYGGFNCEYRGFRINSNRVYTSNFTPPSIDGGLTNIAGTLALWDGLTGSATDASGNNTWSATNMTFSAAGEVADYAKAGGGYGAYQSGQSCGPSHSTDEDKALGGTFDTNTSDGGGNGGNGMVYTGCRQGGGGAGGYDGYGKNLSGYPSNHQYSGCSGSDGANGGGGGGAGANNSSAEHSGGGGGVGIYGQGANGTKADTNQNGNPEDNTDFAGKGGSTAHGTGLDAYTNRYSKDSNNPNYNNHGARGGMTGYNRWRGNYYSSTSSTNYKGQDGGFPGGGGGGGHGSDIWGMGGHGVVRIIWGQVNGAEREFGSPGTNVDISTTYDSDADIFRIGTQPQY
mgnify:CR=1 FL=1|tara:strand:- start:3474 stop:6506 length:3033 start_codon:yes stop_codon:yes gene_type:complete